MYDIYLKQRNKTEVFSVPFRDLLGLPHGECCAWVFVYLECGVHLLLEHFLLQACGELGVVEETVEGDDHAACIKSKPVLSGEGEDGIGSGGHGIGHAEDGASACFILFVGAILGRVVLQGVVETYGHVDERGYHGLVTNKEIALALGEQMVLVGVEFADALFGECGEELDLRERTSLLMHDLGIDGYWQSHYVVVDALDCVHKHLLERNLFDDAEFWVTHHTIGIVVVEGDGVGEVVHGADDASPYLVCTENAVYGVFKSYAVCLGQITRSREVVRGTLDDDVAPRTERIVLRWIDNRLGRCWL